MVDPEHKARWIEGERAVIIDICEKGKDRREKEGIFRHDESHKVVTKDGIDVSLEFIHPIYSPEEYIIKLVNEQGPGINPDNPILEIYEGVNYQLLKYLDKKEGRHMFEGPLHYELVGWFNDCIGNAEFYKFYRKRLEKAGFKTGKTQS